jgi:isoleucyl-tRNA synthetase
MKSLGADILRLWIASTDYASEIAVSDEILKRVADSYRRLRNTARFLLGNLSGFDPERDLVPVKDMLLLDRWALAQAQRVMALARRVYGSEAGAPDAGGPDAYEYQTLCQELMRFCTVDLGAAYLDMTKDRLYTLRAENPARRSAQTAMYWTLEILVRAFAPVLSFTADEIWALMPARKHDSALFSTWADLAPLADASILTAAEADQVAQLLALRDDINLEIEKKRNAKEVGGSLDATVDIAAATPEARAKLEAYGEELRFFFITSDVRISNGAAGGRDFAVHIGRAEAPKCVRCWHHRADVGANAEHPEICARCVENVDGAGETRRWF